MGLPRDKKMKQSCVRLCFLLIMSFLSWGDGYALFSQNGSVITQTGTDTNLSGLVGLTGVTVDTASSVMQYDIGNNILVINGTLSIATTQKEQLIFRGITSHNEHAIEVSGTLNIGTQLVDDYFYTFNDGVPAIRYDFEFADDQEPWIGFGEGNTGTRSVFYVDDGGTLNIYGQIMHIRGAVAADPNTTVNWENAVVHADMIYIFSTNWRIVDTNIYTPGNHSLVTIPLEYQNVGGTNSGAFYISLSNSTPEGTYILRDIPDIPSSVYLTRAGRESGTPPILRALNSADGSDHIFDTATDGAQRRFQVLMESEFFVTASLLDGTPIEDAQVWYQGKAGTNTVVTTDVNGETPVQTFLLRDFLNPAGTTIPVEERFDKNEDGTDRIDVSVWSYNHFGSISQNVSLKGTGEKEFLRILFPDTNITEPSKAVVDGYAEIDDFEKLYDRAKSYKIDNVEYPSVEWQVIDASGETLNLGSKDLVIDGTAVSPFAIDQFTNTITVRAGAMDCLDDTFTRLVTTGTVTFQNGASPGTCIFTDTNGTNGVLTLTGVNNASVLVYDDDDVADATISYQTGVSGDVIIPFLPTSSLSYKVVVRRKGYSEENFSFDPSSGGFFEFPIAQFQSLTIEGSPVYQNSGDILKASIDFSGQRINIGDFTMPSQELYDILQDYEITEEAMKYPRIANYDGEERLLLLNGYQIRNRDGIAALPGINGFIFAEIGNVLDASNGSVQFLADNAVIDRQAQIISMLENMQGSIWDNNTEVFATPQATLTNITGTGFDPNLHSLSNQVNEMLNRGILNFNTMKDLLE